MKFSKKHIFFPITVLITGLAAMPAYSVNGSSSEEKAEPKYSIGTVVSPEVDTQLSFSDAHLFRRGEIVAVESAQHPGKYEYRPITFAEEIEPGFDMESFGQNLPVKAESFDILIGNRMHNFPSQKIGKITAYKIGEIVPEWLQKLEQFAFDEKNTTIPNGEMVMVRRSDGTLRFGRVVHKADLRGEVLYEVLVDGQTGASKTLPAKQVGRITHYL